MQTLTLKDAEVAALLKAGKIGVLPTDTIYGVVADASNPAAVEKLYKLKSRDQKPGTIVAASIDQLVGLGIPRRYLTAVEQFWPGPVSVIVPTGTELQYLHLGKISLACRVPNDEALRQLLEKTGPLVTSSANTPGKAPAETLKQAEKYFDERVDFYVDGGDLSGRAPSTIIRIVDDAIEVVRQGAVTIDETTGEIVS